MPICAVVGSAAAAPAAAPVALRVTEHPSSPPSFAHCLQGPVVQRRSRRSGIRLGLARWWRCGDELNGAMVMARWF